MKRTYQPNRRKRAKTHGFRKRMNSVGGRRVVADRRRRGRKRLRLTDSPEFERVYRQGTAYRGKLFSVHAFPNEHGTPRLGLSVSRKVGNAVTRNAVRRRLREVFHSCISGMSEDLDIVVSAK